MSIDVRIDTKTISDSLAVMLGKLDHFRRVDIGAGLSEFQVEDMHRNRPFTMRSRAKGLATTKIRPHSLYEMKRAEGFRRKVVRRFSKKMHISLPLAREYIRYSSRPVLRAEMYAVLENRLLDMLHNKIKWEK